MSTLTSYNGLQVVTPDPSAAGALAINDNFKALSTPLVAGNPTASDDSTQGYTVGSRWFNSTDGTECICTDPTASAAVWVELGSTGIGSTNGTVALSSTYGVTSSWANVGLSVTLPVAGTYVVNFNVRCLTAGANDYFILRLYNTTGS